MIQEIERNIAVSPRNQIVERIIGPMSSGLGDLDVEKAEETDNAADADNEWERLANKYEELEKKVNEYFNDDQNLGMRKPPIVLAPLKMTKEDW